MTEIVRVPFRDRQAPETLHVDYPPEFVYVIEFTTGVIKVGYSTSPDKRIGQHRAESRRFGADIARTWVSQPHSDARTNETSLKEYCSTTGSAEGGVEYFRGVRFEAVVEHAQTLPFEPPRPGHDIVRPAMSRFNGGVPRPIYADGMELAVSLSIALWDEILRNLDGRAVTAEQLRSLVDGAHRSIIESTFNPAAWAEGVS